MKEVNVREAVTLTGYTRQQIYNLVVNGRVPARKEGHEYRLDRAALVKYARGRNKQIRQNAA